MFDHIYSLNAGLIYMRDANDVISQAVNGYTTELAKDMEVSLPRMYQLLSDKCPYPKTKRLIRYIAKHSQKGARLIKADLDSMFADVLDKPSVNDLSAADLHRESFEAVQSLLEDKPDAVKKAELRELISIAQLMLAGLDKKANLKAV